MNNFDKCPVCRSRKMENQPEPIEGRQDVFYVCGCAVTYEVDNPDNSEDTGICENKIDWENIYIDYGKEFDENAKLVDNRFYGWVELQFYKEVHHSNNWKNRVNFLDQEILDEYFDNKEMYIKKLRELNEDSNIQSVYVPGIEPDTNQIRGVEVRKYYQEPIVGTFIVEKVESFTSGDYEVSIYKIISSKDHPDKAGNFVVEEVCDDFKKNRINFYDNKIIDIINRERARL